MNSFIHQCCTLAGRNLRVVLASRSNVATTLVQAPLIAAFALIAFVGFHRDDDASNQVSRVVHYFFQFKAPYEQHGDTMPLYEDVIPKTKHAVETDTSLIGAAAAQRRAAVYFVLVW